MAPGGFRRARDPDPGSAANIFLGDRYSVDGGGTGGIMRQDDIPLGDEILICHASHVMVRGTPCADCDGQQWFSSQLEFSTSRRVGDGGHGSVFLVGETSSFGGNPLGVSGFLGNIILVRF